MSIVQRPLHTASGLERATRASNELATKQPRNAPGGFLPRENARDSRHQGILDPLWTLTRAVGLQSCRRRPVLCAKGVRFLTRRVIVWSSRRPRALIAVPSSAARAPHQTPGHAGAGPLPR